MLLSLTKNELESIIFKISGTYPDELSLLESISPFCDEQDIKSAKILFLVGCSREFRVNGVSFEDRQEIIKQMSEKDNVYFEPEPENKHDINAIKVLFKEQLVGYLPRKIACLLQDCIQHLCGEVSRIVGDEQEDVDKDTEEKFLGIRFIFRRKGSINKKQIVNLDTVDLILEDYIGTAKEVIAQTQFFALLEKATNDESNEQERYKTATIEEMPDQEQMENEVIFAPSASEKETNVNNSIVPPKEEIKQSSIPPVSKKNISTILDEEEDIF